MTLSLSMKERQRWRSEEDDVLLAYVKQNGPRDWNLLSLRLNDRDAKSCLERWKNYLKPGIKKGPLTAEEQILVVRLQAKHGNKWKTIAAQVPGRTAKRLGKWWEVHKEKQQRSEQRESRSLVVESKNYDRILENFAEKLVKAMSNPLLPPWLSSNNGNGNHPSVVLTLSSPSSVFTTPARQLQTDNCSNMIPGGFGGRVIAELAECCRDVEEGHRAWMLHKKEVAWRLKRVELQLESEKARKRRGKTEEMEAKMRALREEQQAALERIEAEFREQVVGLRRDAEEKEQKVAEQWAAKHARLAKFLEQVGWSPAELNRMCR